MKTLLTFCLMLTCATLHAQSVIVKATGAGAVHATGAGSVRGVAIPPTYTYTNYSDGRFTIWNTNQDVVVDNGSGRTWARNANIDGTKYWTNAIAYCSNLTYATHSDWRLPNTEEFSRYVANGGATNGLLDAYPSANDPALPTGHPFTNVQSSTYWSSDENAFDAPGIYLGNGDINELGKNNAFYVWPCRGP